VRICTQNATALLKVEREQRALDWHAACNEVEARVGRPTPANVEEFRRALEEAEEALPSLASEMDVPWPGNPEEFAALLARTGAYALVLEQHEGEVVGVAHVPA
jgi:hypothetical protein